MQKSVEECTVKELLEHPSKIVRIMTETLVKEVKESDDEEKKTMGKVVETYDMYAAHTRRKS